MVEITISSGDELRTITIGERLSAELDPCHNDLTDVTDVKAAITAAIAERLWRQGKTSAEVAGWLTAETREYAHDARKRGAA